MPRKRLGQLLVVVVIVVAVSAAVMWGLVLAFSATPARGESYELVST